MIILPDKNIPRAKILMPVHDREWREPSLTQPKDQFGNQNRTRFILTARLSDGFVKWKGYFECRDDADAFLYSLVCGSLHYEKELWKLPTPYWSPCIDEGVVYDQLLVETIITAPTGSDQTYTRPSDWNQFTNRVDTIGAGGGGARRNNTGQAGAGGAGGGAYSGSTGVVIGATASYRIGALGAGATTLNTSGGTGGDTWFNGTTVSGASVSAQGGIASTTGSSAGGAGGATTGNGATKYAGGNGGGGQSPNGAAGGGGGAAGPNAIGGFGIGAVSGTGGNGGRGDGTFGGAGATSTASPGGAGTEWTTAGSGGGGKGGSGSPSAGGAGGNYGAGGGGGGTSSGSSSAGGSGTGGIIRITYTPEGIRFNMPMLGM